MLSEPAEIRPVARALHEEAVTVCKRLRGAEHALAVLLARIHDEKLHHDLGYANVLDYAEELLGLPRSKAEGLLRLGRSLQRLPVLDRAWSAGEVDWTKARDMLSILTPENEAAWVERAGRRTNRELEADLRVTLTGEPPPSHVEPPKAPARTRLTFTLDTVDAEIVKTVLQWARSTLGEDRDDVGDGELLAALLQRVMHDVPSTSAPTGERFRVVVQRCPECGQTSGLDAELTDTKELTASCDAEILEMREGPQRGHLTRTIPPATRRAVLQRDRYACQVPGCSNRLHLDVHHVKSRACGGGHDEDNLVTLCGVHHDLVHDGRLGVERRGGALVFTFPSGRAVERWSTGGR
jgi:5-methylcytosine-specific restriction endonuclease McrA